MPQMTGDAKLHHLMARLATLGTWEPVRGPRHPTAPNPTPASAIARFLASYPVLRRDPGYIDFLECYAGAFVADAEETLTVDLPDRSYRVAVQTVDLFGFSPIAPVNLIWGDEEDPTYALVDADGFLPVAVLNVDLHKLDASLPGGDWLFASKSIAVDATGQRPWGVYAQALDPAGSGPIAYWSIPTYLRCWATFLEFLADLVTGEAVYPPGAVR